MAEVPPINVVGYEYAGKPVPTFVGPPIGLADRNDTSYLPCPGTGTPFPTFRADFPAVLPGEPMILLARTRRTATGSSKYFQIALADDPWFFTPGDVGGGSLASHDLPHGTEWTDSTGWVQSVENGYYDDGVHTPEGPFSMWITVEGFGSVDLSYIALLAEPLPPVITGRPDVVRRRFMQA